MPKQALHDALATLDAQLRAGTPISDDDRALLEQVRSDLDTLLANDAARPETLRPQVTDALQRFEARHPDLANLMGRVIDALNRMGV